MSADLKLDQFSGPLDLLLQLIDQEELNITEVSLSQVTEQYFGYLDKLEKNRSRELADFLVIATRLIYLKSRQLLPYLYPEEEKDQASLADQLKMYKKYVEAGRHIDERWDQAKLAYGRQEPVVKLAEFVLPSNAQVTDLQTTMVALIKRLKPISPLPEVTIDHSISVKQTIDKIRDLLKAKRQFSFRGIMSGAKNRTEVIVNFLALLELVRQKDVAVQQSSPYGDLNVKAV